MPRPRQNSVLILSTTPPLPREYGNRNRVHQTMSFFEKLSYRVSFLLYPFDHEWVDGIPAYTRELMDRFDYFDVIPNSRPLHQNAASSHHHIDEWWDRNIATRLDWLFARKRFDVLFVNYTFLSKAFDHAPPGTLRVLDTHDVFSGRREMLEAHGVAPEFFYTVPEQEAVAFARADAVLAIKQSEADFIQQIYGGTVITVPYFDDRAQLPEMPPAASLTFDEVRPLRLGFIGAENSVNVVNMRCFLAIFSRYVKMYHPPVEIRIAGNVCRGLREEYPFVRLLGPVESVESFYKDVDAVIAPLEFSTGLKIKVGEALARTVPVLATRNAFDGYRAFHDAQAEASLHALCDRIVGVAFGEQDWAVLGLASWKAARAALQAQERGFAALRNWLRDTNRILLVVTDRPFWRRDSFLAECSAQAVEFLGTVHPMVVCCVTEDEPAMQKVHAKFEHVAVPDIGGLADFVAAIRGECHIAGVVTVLAGAELESTCRSLLCDEAPVWSITPEGSGVNTRPVLRQRPHDPEPLALTPLRYRPAFLTSPAQRQAVTLVLPAVVAGWAAVAAAYVRMLAAEAGIPVREIAVPQDALTDSGLYGCIMRELTSRLVLVTDDSPWLTFLEALCLYGGCDHMVLDRDFIYPESVGERGEASLERSVREFLAGTLPKPTLVDPNAGWARAWSILAAQFGAERKEKAA